MEMTKQEWNARASTPEHAEFLQSYEWGEFQKLLRRAIVRKGETQSFFSAIRVGLPLGFSYWYIPRGPRLTRENVSAWHTTVRDIVRDAVFLRFEPIYHTVEEGKEILQEIEKVVGRGRVRQTKDIQSKMVWVLDLSKNTDELLSGMHTKTRYNIRLAERKGVSVICAQTQEDALRACEVFLTLAKKTSHRHEFRLHPDTYYRTMAQAMRGVGETGDVNFFVYIARHEERDIAAALVMCFGDTATYLHGGSDEACKEVMAPHALHWQIIQDMSARGVRWYDMGGVDMSGNLKHPWAGITRFKQGFGGGVRQYVGTYDLIFRPILYTLYGWIQQMRRG